MFCTRCGFELRESDKYCSECAAPVSKRELTGSGMIERLSRPRQGRKIAGVCAGLARYLRLDVTLMRVVAVFLVFWPVPLVAALGYILLWIVMPKDPAPLPQPYSQVPVTSYR